MVSKGHDERDVAEKIKNNQELKVDEESECEVPGPQGCVRGDACRRRVGAGGQARALRFQSRACENSSRWANLTHQGLGRFHCVTKKTRPRWSLPPARCPPLPRMFASSVLVGLLGGYECAMWCPSVLFCLHRWVVTPPWAAVLSSLEGCVCRSVRGHLCGDGPCVSCPLAVGWSVSQPRWRPHFPSVLHLETVPWPPCSPRVFTWVCLPSACTPASLGFNPESPVFLTGAQERGQAVCQPPPCGDGRWSRSVTVALRVCEQQAFPPCLFPCVASLLGSQDGAEKVARGVLVLLRALAGVSRVSR